MASSGNDSNLPHDSQAGSIIGVTVSMLVLSILAVIARFWSRYITQGRAGWWWDDWLCLFTLPFIIAVGGMMLAWVDHGLGKHVWDVKNPEDVSFGLKMLWTCFLLANLACTFPKLSALAFYFRVFDLKSKKGWKICNWVIAALALLWWTGLMLHMVLFCQPISLNWQPKGNQRCSHDWQTWLASAVFCVFIDLLILIFPLPHLFPLRMDKRRKLGLVILFIFGYLVFVTTIGRLVYTVKASAVINNDLTYQIVPALCWIIAETPVSVISVSIPCMYALMRRASDHGLLSIFSTKSDAKLTQEKSYAWTDTNASDTKRGSGQFDLPIQHPTDSQQKLTSENSFSKLSNPFEPHPQNSYLVTTDAEPHKAEAVPEQYIQVDREVNVTRGPEP